MKKIKAWARVKDSRLLADDNGAVAYGISTAAMFNGNRDGEIIEVTISLSLPKKTSKKRKAKRSGK